MRYLLFILLTASAFAQQPGNGARELNLRLLAFDNMKIPEECFAFDPAAPPQTAGVKAPVKGYLNHETAKVLLTGSELVFSKSAKIEDARKPEFQLGKVAIPKTGNRFMLIFLPMPAGKEGFHIMPLDDSVREFPLGAYRVISLSSFPVRLTLEKKVYEFKPGQSSLIEDAPVQANNHSSMYAYSFLEGKWARIGAGLWPHPGRKRSVQIFYDNPDSKRTELRGFRDISPPVPNAAPPAG